MITFDYPEATEPRQQPSCHQPVGCSAARVHAQMTSIATVVNVDGDIDASNADLLFHAIRSFSHLKGPLILDLRHLDFLGLAGFQVLLALNHEFEDNLLHCSVIGGASLRRLTRIYQNHGLPVVDSIPEALTVVDAIVQSRRRFLVDLVQERAPRHKRFSVRIAGMRS